MSSIRVLNIFAKLKQGGGPLNTFRVNDVSTCHHDYICNASNASVDGPIRGKIHNYEVDRMSFFTLAKILKGINIREYQIIHAQGRGGAAYALLIKIVCILINHRIHIVYTYRGLIKYAGVKGFLQKVVEFLISYLATSFICVSFSELRSSLKYYPVRKDKSVIIPNGIIDKNLNNMSSLLCEKIQDRYEIVIVGRISSEKDVGHSMLLAKNIFESIGSYKVKIIGEVVPENHLYLKSLEQLVTKNKLNDVVTFCGSKDRTSCLHEIMNADYIISSSDSEGLPTVLIEAQVLSTVCIASSVQGNVEENAIVLRDYIKSSDLNKIRKAAHEDAIKGFNVPAVVNILDNHYVDILCG